MSLHEDLLAEKRRRAYAADPWLWIRECVWTVDEVDRVSPIKRFPVAVCVRCQRYVGGDEVRYAATDGDVFEGGLCRVCEGPLQELAYLRWLTRAWQAAGNRGAGYRDWPSMADHPPVLAIPKPRRMRLSWLMVSCTPTSRSSRPTPRCSSSPASSRSPPS